MLTERTHGMDMRPGCPTARRVWDGFVRGHADCWVVVPRDEWELAEWSRCEDEAVTSVPLRLCRAILDDGWLVLAPDEAR